MIRPISVATDGLIDDRSPLSIAARGYILIPTPAGEVVIVRRKHGRGASVENVILPFPWPEPIRVPVVARKIGRDIHQDDDEVLAILIQTIVNGLLN